MSLYQKLFGMNLMAPAGEEEFTSSGGDRGDNHIPDDNSADEAAAAGEEAAAEAAAAAAAAGEAAAAAAEAATGKTAERDAGGKFTKKEKGDDEGVMIPKSRFDSAVVKERERAETAERRLAEAMAQQGQIKRNVDITAAENKVADLRKQERQAIVDGDEDKASQLSSEADRLNRQIAISQAGDMSTAAKEQALEGMRMELAVENIEANYPALDENSDEFDQDITDDVLDKQRGYMDRERLPASKALLKAVKYVMARQNPAPAAESTGKTGLSSAAKGVDRKVAAVGKNLDAARRQPAGTKQVGADSDKHGQTAEIPEAGDMTFEEFGALPESTKAKMRGDFV